MACNTCGQAGSNCGCDTSCFGGTANWLVPVNVAPPIEMASRKFAYITPDQVVWVVNHDGTEVIPIDADDVDWIIDANVALPPLADAEMFRIYRQDDKMLVVNEDRTDWIDLADIGGTGFQVQSDWEETNVAEKSYIKNKPTIPAEQVQSDWNVSDTASKAFIKNKPSIPAEQVQANWNETNASSKAFIQNKPDIPSPTPQIQSDWNQVDPSMVDFIKHKPTIVPQVQANWDETDTDSRAYIQNKPTIPTPVEQVQANWNETDTASKAFIQNKPTIPTPIDIHHGASFVAKTATSTPVSVSANTLVSLNVTDVFTGIPVNTYPSTQTVLDVLGSNTVGQPFVIKEGSQAGQAVDFDIVFGITPNFGGNQTATLIWEIYSLGSNTVVRTGQLTQTSSMPTGYTKVPHTIKATLVADQASLTNGYAIRLISDRPFTYDVSRVVRSINAMDVQE